MKHASEKYKAPMKRRGWGVGAMAGPSAVINLNPRYQVNLGSDLEFDHFPWLLFEWWQRMNVDRYGYQVVAATFALDRT